MTCPVHEFPLKDERGCWKCLDELRVEGKLEAKAAQPKKLYTIPKVSKKQAKLNRDLSKTRPEVMAEGCCTGCGKPEGGIIILEDSHKISRAECEKYGRMDLYTDVRNRTPHCRTWLDYKGCHSKWESNAERHTLRDYKSNMQFIKSEIPQLALRMLMNQERAIKGIL